MAVLVIMSSQDTLDPGSRPGFTVSITYSARALAGRTRPPYTVPSATVASSVQNCSTVTSHFQDSQERWRTSPPGPANWDGFTGTCAPDWRDSGKGVNRYGGMVGIGYLRPLSKYLRPQSAMATMPMAKSRAFLPKYLRDFTSSG